MSYTDCLWSVIMIIVCGKEYFVCFISFKMSAFTYIF